MTKEHLIRQLSLTPPPTGEGYTRTKKPSPVGEGGPLAVDEECILLPFAFPLHKGA